MTKSVNQMSANEYKEWLLSHPEEAKELDKPSTKAVIPTIVWRNGVAVQIAGPTTPQDGVVQG